MPIKFNPLYRITPTIANTLTELAVLKEKIFALPLTPTVLASLRETARLYTTHYSTMIEGNRLEPSQITQVLKNVGHFPGKERDEAEVKGYYAALHRVEEWAAQKKPLTESMIQILHALVMGHGNTRRKGSPYRDGQNVIRDARSHSIVYMPPEAKDVPLLMKTFVEWIRENTNIPAPILAAIAHYQFATIHPYYDGNGRTARLLTTLILHLHNYDLKGLYSLEEYYARHLANYYEAISIGPSHNYYLGRAEADITSWVDYFTQGMLISFENVLGRMQEVKGDKDQEIILRQLDAKQRKALELFQSMEIVSAQQIGKLFGFKPRTSSQLCKKWTEQNFLEIVNPSNKARTYRLGKLYRGLA